MRLLKKLNHKFFNVNNILYIYKIFLMLFHYSRVSSDKPFSLLWIDVLNSNLFSLHLNLFCIIILRINRHEVSHHGMHILIVVAWIQMNCTVWLHYVEIYVHKRCLVLTTTTVPSFSILRTSTSDYGVWWQNIYLNRCE